MKLGSAKLLGEEWVMNLPASHPEKLQEIPSEPIPGDIILPCILAYSPNYSTISDSTLLYGKRTQRTTICPKVL